MEIKVELNEAELKEQALKIASDSARRVVDAKLRDLFNFSSNRSYNGSATNEIIDIIDRLIKSEEFEEKIKKLVYEQIDHSMRTAVHNAVDKAVRKEAHKKADAIMNELNLTARSAICPFCEDDCKKNVGPIFDNLLKAHSGLLNRSTSACGAIVAFTWTSDLCSVGGFCTRQDYNTVVSFLRDRGKLG